MQIPTLKQINNELARRSLSEFVKQSFPIICPGVILDWNWHLDCVCLPYDAIITTPHGPMQIGYIVESGYDGDVLSYNHSLSKMEWKKVSSRFINDGKTIFDIVSSRGDKLSLTGNHPVWANGTYKKAEKVEVGDTILRVVQEGISDGDISIKTEKILQSSMFWSKQSKAAKLCMLFMWFRKVMGRQDMSNMPSQRKKERGKYSLYQLWETNLQNTIKISRSSENQGYILQSKMLWRPHLWLKQPSIYRWWSCKRISSQRLQTNAQEGHNARRRGLLSLWRAAKEILGCSSYRQRQDKQRGMEPCGPMSEMPQQSTRNADRDFKASECVVRSITKSTRIPKKVYNIEVEGNNNYFANGILVHNCNHLEMTYSGDITRLVINIPPRSLKSNIVSICFPAWVLGHKSYEQFMVASHTQRPLSVKLSNDTRLLMQSDWYKGVFPETVIDKNTENVFSTTKNGHRMAVSIGGSPTGLGANYLILDDPNKPDEALSDTIRIKTNEWVDQVFMSRMNDRRTGRLIVVMQRVHENDVTGHLIEKGGDIVHLKLPAIANSRIYINRGGKEYVMEKDDYLHKERLGPETLDELRRDLGDYAFAGQYLQEPVPIGGGLIKTEWIRYYEPKDFNVSQCNLFITCDPANSKKTTSDWTAFQVVALAPDNNRYLVDMVRDKLNPTERVNKLFELHRKWNALSGKSPRVGYEAYGLQSDMHYIKLRQNEENYRFDLVPLGGRTSKADRISRIIPDLQNGRWYFPEKIMYTDHRGQSFNLVDEMVRGEMATFPVSHHDDCLDALASIYSPDMGANFPMIRKVNQPNAIINQYAQSGGGWMS